MPTALATNYLGSNAAAVLLNGGSATRIYYQSADGSIHEAAGTGAAVHNPVYNERVVVTADKVRINSPIAAVAWKDGNNVEQVRPRRWPCNLVTTVTHMACRGATDPPLLRRQGQPAARAMRHRRHFCRLGGRVPDRPQIRDRCEFRPALCRFHGGPKYSCWVPICVAPGGHHRNN